jgi:hypothetical protein
LQHLCPEADLLDFKSSKQFVCLEQVAADNNDPEMSHFIEAKFLTDQVF